MKILIENYRGFEISFETEKETFHLFSNHYDFEKNKVSYQSCKKYIDDFIKENSSFKPFEVHIPITEYNGGRNIKITGIRKDGRFVYDDEKGNKHQVSEYEEKRWIKIIEENEPYFKEIETTKKQIKELEDKVRKLDSNIIKVGLDKIKVDIIANL